MSFNEDFDKACEQDEITTDLVIEDMRMISNVLEFYPQLYPNLHKELCDGADAANIPLEKSLAVIGQLSEILDNRPEIRCQYVWGQD